MKQQLRGIGLVISLREQKAELKKFISSMQLEQSGEHTPFIDEYININYYYKIQMEKFTKLKEEGN